MISTIRTSFLISKLALMAGITIPNIVGAQVRGEIGRPGRPSIQENFRETIFGDVEQEEVDRLERQLRQTEQDRYRVSEELRRKDRDAQCAARDNETALQRARTASAAVQTAQTQLQQLQTKKQNLEAELARAKSERDFALNAATNQLVSTQAEIPRIEFQLKTAEQELANIQGQRNPGRLAAIPGEISGIESDEAPVLERKKQIHERIASLKSIPNQTEMVFLMILTLQNELRDQVEPKLQSFADKKASLNTEKAQLEKIEAAFTAKQKEVNGLVQTLQAKHREVIELQGLIAQLRNQTFPQEAQIAGLVSSIAQAQSRVQTAQADSSRAQNEASRSAQALAIAQADRNALDQTLKFLEADVRELSFQVDKLRQKLPIERIVVVGSRLGSLQERELQNAHATLVSAEIEVLDIAALERGTLSAVYVLADSISLTPSAELVSTLTKLAESGALLVIVGDPDVLTSAPGAEALRKIVGVTSDFSTPVREVSSHGLLSGIKLDPQGVRTRAYTLKTIFGSFSPEVTLKANRFDVIGVSQTVRGRLDNGKVLVTAFDIGTDSLKVLGEIEKAYCKNVSRSFAATATRVCRDSRR